MNKKNVVVTLYEGQEKKLPKVVKALEKMGLEVDSVLEFGVITGAIDEKKIKTVSKRKEIESIAEDTPVQLPPSKSNLQ
jgi:hypothetical protein